MATRGPTLVGGGSSKANLAKPDRSLQPGEQGLKGQRGPATTNGRQGPRRLRPPWPPGHPGESTTGQHWARPRIRNQAHGHPGPGGAWFRLEACWGPLSKAGFRPLGPLGLLRPGAAVAPLGRQIPDWPSRQKILKQGLGAQVETPPRRASQGKGRKAEPGRQRPPFQARH